MIMPTEGSKQHTDLDRPDDNRLLGNYDLHDIGHDHFVQTAREWGYDVEDWGLDKRENTGTIVYDDRMDFRLWSDDLVALVDVKTKSNPSWVGKFNKRHYNHYSKYVDEYDVPVVVGMYLVGETRVKQEHYIPIIGDGQIIDRTFTAPDGNRVIDVDESYFRSREWLQQIL